LWNVDGIVLFPPIALVCVAALFFVYGFRPECIPLLIFTIVINIINLPAFFSVANHLRNTDYRDKGQLFFIVLFFLLAGVIVTAIYFSPEVDTKLTNQNVRNIKLENTVSDANGKHTYKYFLRLYDPTENTAKQALIFLVPPVLGSVSSVDMVCSALRDYGYSVLTYSRADFDMCARSNEGTLYLPNFNNILHLIKSENKPWAKKDSNKNAVFLEEERAKDIEFLSSYIENNIQTNNIFFIAYNEGGSALIKNLENLKNSFTKPISGVIAVESLLLSNFKQEDAVVIQTNSKNIMEKVKVWFINMSNKNTAEKITELASVDHFTTPVLFLMSDAIVNSKDKLRYAAVFKTQEENKDYVQILSEKGYGIFDYSDIPQKYPIISFLFKGRTKPEERKNIIQDMISFADASINTDNTKP
jgi:hypothetical protein